MPVLTVQVNYALQGKAPETMKFPIEVDQEQLERLLPPPPLGGSAGWPYWDEALRLIAPFVKRELFYDETTPVESVDDFRRLGLWHLHFYLRNGRDDTLSMPIIVGTPEQLP